ncbi:hypothetical protein [Vulcanococcus limneticus]|uniref:hypothetical protein n=1 Tax=Vulcanococcus limneticus TaxID=2170428 RepID=UPI00398BE6E7
MLGGSFKKDTVLIWSIIISQKCQYLSGKERFADRPMAVAFAFCFRVRLALSLSLCGSWPRWFKHSPHGFGFALAAKQSFCPTAQSVDDKQWTTNSGRQTVGDEQWATKELWITDCVIFSCYFACYFD